MASSHMGVAITPATLADGSLHAALDPRAVPGLELVDESTPYAADEPEGSLGVADDLVVVLAGSAGTLAAGSHTWAIAAVNALGTGEPCPDVTHVAVLNNTATLTWGAVDGETAGYKVYRDGLHLHDVAHGVLTYDDTGAITPTGAEPTAADAAVIAGELEGELAPKPVDPGAQPVEGEGDSATPTEAVDTVGGTGVS